VAMSSPSTTAVESVPPLSEPQRLLNTFIAPSKTFTDLNRKPSWWAPWLLAALLSLLFSYALQQKVGFDQIAEKAANATPRSAERFEKMEPAQREQELGRMTVGFGIFFYAFPLLVLVSGMVIAGVLLLTFNFGMGADITFKKALAVVFYAFVPLSVLSNIIVIASIMAPGFVAESFNLENPAATNLAALLDHSSTSRALYTLAVGVDIFNIWTVILLGIGFSCVSKIKRSTAILAVAGWLLLWKLIQAGLALAQ
jgi:Yip1-like protein